MTLVLVVEDDPSTTNYLEYHLRSDGYDVVTAGSVGEAWKRITETPPHAAIVDIQLPGVYGWELVRRIRGDAALRDIPLIVCSGILGERERAEAAGLRCEAIAKHTRRKISLPACPTSSNGAGTSSSSGCG